MSIPANCRYTKEHEWAKEEGDVIVVGITDYAQTALGDVVFIELPIVGKEVSQGGSFATVESVKAASDVYAPLEGSVVATNGELADAPEKINNDPHGSGWMIKIKPSNKSQLTALMDSKAYESYVAELSK